MVADAVVYHPTVAHFLKFVATTAGRDKLLRIFQYWARFYAWYLARSAQPAAHVASYDAVKKNLGAARKLLRLGKFVEHFKAAAVAADDNNNNNRAKGSDALLRFCTVGRQLGYAGYMLFDNATVPDVVGFRKSPGIKRIQEQAYRAWLTGLLFSVVSGAYTLAQLRKRRRAVDGEEEAGSVVERRRIQIESNTAKLQLVSDLCDLTVPLSALGHVSLDDGVVGLAGTVSSLLGLYTVWKKTA